MNDRGTGWQSWAGPCFAFLGATLTACDVQEPSAWTAPDLLIVDYHAGVFRRDADDCEVRMVAGEADGLKGPRRVLRLEDGRIVIVATGDGDGAGRALFLYHDDTGTVEPWIDLEGQDIPTDIVQTGPATLLMSTRRLVPEDRSRNSSALHEIDLRDGSVHLLLEPPEFVAVLSLFLEDGGRSVLVLDGDADPNSQEYFEGVLFRYDLSDGSLETVRVFENTVSPLQLHPLAGTVREDEADFLLVDVNALHPPGAPWIGELFLMDAAKGDVRPFLIDEHHLIDPVRGFLHQGRLVLAEMSSNPGGYDTVETVLSYAHFRGRGAIYTVDLATKAVEPLVHDPRFLDPVDVLGL